MIPTIESRLSALDKRREALVARVEALPLAKQQAHPIAKAFSPAEIIEHFALTTDFNLTFLKKTAPRSLQGKSATPRFLYNMTIKMCTNATSPVNTMPAMTPKSTVDVKAAAQHWATSSSVLQGFLDQVTDPDTAFIKMMWLFGTLSANQLLDLMEVHIDYHERRFPKV